MPSAVAPVSSWDHLAQLYGPSQPSTPCSALEEQVPAKIPKNEFSQKTQTGILIAKNCNFGGEYGTGFSNK